VSFLEQLLLGWESARSALRLALKPVIGLPWLALGCARLATLGVLAFAAHPLISWAMVPVVSIVTGPGALHYPVLFRFLPRLLDRVQLPIDVLLGGWVAGLTSLQVVAISRRNTAPFAGAARESLRRLPVLVAAQLPALALAWLLDDGLKLLLEVRGSGPLVTKVLGVLVGTLLGVVFLLFCWLPVIVVVGGHGVTGSWSELRRMSGRGFGAALVIGLLMAVPIAPFAFALRGPGRWIDLGHPEWVVALLGFERLVALVTGLVATIALALAWGALEAEDPWGA
jgi:hypothetical protein